MNKEEKRIRNNENAKRWRQNHREQVSEINKKQYDKIKDIPEYKEKKKSYHELWYQENKEEIKKDSSIPEIHEKKLEYDKQRYKLNRDEILLKKKIFYQENSETLKERKKQWNKENPDKRLEIERRYNKNNPEKIREKNARRYRHRVPRWITKEELKAINNFYKNCPEGMVVDHIIPLQGENVSGFHTLKNLQYLSKKDNLTKSNKFPYYPLKFYMDKGLMGVKNYGNLRCPPKPKLRSSFNYSSGYH